VFENDDWRLEPLDWALLGAIALILVLTIWMVTA
jgi:hypothetical protein